MDMVNVVAELSRSTRIILTRDYPREGLLHGSVGNPRLINRTHNARVYYER